MSAAVEPLDLADAATVEALVALQRASYRVEADLIGAATLPPLTETPDELRASGETFLGAFDAGGGGLLGAVAYKRSGDLVDIHRLMVDPTAFRRGIATLLLDALEGREPDAERWTVGTGAGNRPALSLYERRGFRVAEERTMPGGVGWVRLDRAGGTPAGAARPWKALLAGCLALAALSLLLPSVPTYDPWAWIVWGREITQLDLVTVEGPSWKPLPVLFTTPFALAGDEWAPELWLVVARAGGLLAFGMAYRLGSRLAGPAAGAIAAGGLVLCDDFIRNFARGNSEGLLVALCLWTIERHLDGRRRDAFLLGFAAGLLRPEVWPFWGLYGLWLIADRWRGRFPWRTAAIVAGSGVALLALWFVPEWIGSGSALRAAERARDPNPDSAAFAASPFLEVFRRSASILMPPIYAGGLVAVLIAVRRWRRGERSGIALILAAVSTVLMVAVALMTEVGFAGNLRYVALPAALVCVLAGAGWVWLVRGAAKRLGTAAGAAAAVLALAAFVPFVKVDISELDRDMRLVAEEADFYGENLRAAIARGGGERGLRRCGSVYTGPFHVQAVAWYLHMHGDDVEIFPLPPGSSITPHYSALARDPRFDRETGTSQWVVGRACP